MANTPNNQTVTEHLAELRSRLIRVLLIFFVGLGVGWSLQDRVVEYLLRPAGDQTLIYTAPAGGFQLVFQASLLVGALLATPVLVLQIAKFVAPIFNNRKSHNLYLITLASSVLALIGASFAYFWSLPFAIKFLSQFGGGHVETLLSVDSYLSFALLYIGGYALLFQLPLLLWIINKITPLPPKRLLGLERYVILISFIVAAILTPTPDMVNQVILAGPMIVLYQVGVVVIWYSQRRSRKSSASASRRLQEAKELKPKPLAVTAAEPAGPVGPIKAAPSATTANFANPTSRKVELRYRNLTKRAPATASKPALISDFRPVRVAKEGLM